MLTTQMAMAPGLMTLALKFSSSRQEQDEEEDATEENGGIWPERRRTDLDSSTWERMPADLLFGCILVRLSFPCLLRLRCVSRSWRSRLSSSTFWRRWFRHKQSPSSLTASSPPVPHAVSKSRDGNAGILESILSSSLTENSHVPRFFLVSGMPCADLPPAALRWMKTKSVKFARKPATAGHYHWLRLCRSFFLVQEPYTLLYSDNGILLIVQHDIESKSGQFVVCNPLLRQRKFLPSPAAPLVVSAIQFFVDPDSGDYVIFVDDLHFYLSASGKWEVIPQTLHVGENSASPALLDGSMFWISQKKLIRSNDVVLCVYYAKQRIVTRLRTRFPCKVFFPQHCLVWKDTQGLQTLAVSAHWAGVWKLDDRIWRKLKRLPFEMQDGFELYVSKIGNLLILTCQRMLQKNFFIFDLERDKGAFIPSCGPFTEVMGHWSYEPSYFDV